MAKQGALRRAPQPVVKPQHVAVPRAVLDQVAAKLARLNAERLAFTKCALARRLRVSRDTLYRVLAGGVTSPRVVDAVRAWATAA